MAQLKDSVVTGNLQVTNEALTETLQTNIIKAPSESGGSTYGVGADGQVLKSNGTSVYWGADNDHTDFVANNQGTGNSGKFLTVNSSGQVVCSDFSDMVTTRTSSDLAVSGATVTAPAGYYASSASASVSNGSATTPATTITANPSISVNSSGLITATASATQSVTPTVTAGYVSSGTAGTITVSGSNTSQLTTQGAQTIVPGTTDKTIASGKYLTGTQTIKGDADLIASNIKKGVVLFDGQTGAITGTFTTTPSGKTAMTATSLRSGYSGFINGAQVDGSMADTTVTEGKTTVSSTTATRGTWSQTAGYTASRTIAASTFGNEATTGHTYVDISGTTASPVLVAGDYLYINKGYTDDLKISLAKLVPDGSDVKGHGEYLLSGHSAYDNDGTLVAGTIPTIASTDITVSGKTVTVPVGYYTGASNATAVSVNVATGSATTPATTITSAPTITVSSAGLITATNSKTQSVTPTVSAGYVSSGTAGTITVSGSNTSQLTVQAAQTITPTTTDQTIASGKYLTGTQTIKGDANLIPANIKNGVSIFGVTGTHKGYTVTETTDAGGGTIVNITTEGGNVDTLSWIGKNAELIDTFTAVTGNLGDTTFPSWTASTTASNIKATANLTTFTADMENYEYVIVWKCNLDVAHNSGATLKVVPHRSTFVGVNILYRQPANLTALVAGNCNSAIVGSYSYWFEAYYNSSGTLTKADAPSYGFYFNAPTPTFANATNPSTTVTVKTPLLYARCSTTYFATARKTEVDYDNSPYTMQGYLYRINKNGCFRSGLINELVSFYNT